MSKSVFLSAVAVTLIEIVGAIAAVARRSPRCPSRNCSSPPVRLYFMSVHARHLPSRTVAIARRQETTFRDRRDFQPAALSLWTLAAFFLEPVGFTLPLGATMTIAYAFGM